MKKKIVILGLALVLAFALGIGGTLAWLTAQTGTVTNTFTTSDITVELKETKTDFKMIPGYTIAKDPKVTVTTDSEECWLFVKVEESTNFDSYLTYEMADGWTAGKGDKTETNPTADGIPTNVYYRKVETAHIGTAYSVLKDDKVTVKDTVTKAMMESAKTSQPTLSFTAFASQLNKNATEEFTAAEAWEVLNPPTT